MYDVIINIFKQNGFISYLLNTKELKIENEIAAKILKTPGNDDIGSKALRDLIKKQN